MILRNSSNASHCIKRLRANGIIIEGALDGVSFDKDSFTLPVNLGPSVQITDNVVALDLNPQVAKILARAVSHPLYLRSGFWGNIDAGLLATNLNPTEQQLIGDLPYLFRCYVIPVGVLS